MTGEKLLYVNERDTLYPYNIILLLMCVTKYIHQTSDSD